MIAKRKRQDTTTEGVLEFRILGPIGVLDQEKEISLGGSKQRSVLAALLLGRGQVVSDIRMGALLWGEDPPATASAQIHTYMSRLRKQLGSRVTISRQHMGYRMESGQSLVDSDEFEKRARSGHTALQLGHYEEAAKWLRAALGMWRGPALSNATQQLVEVEGPRLEEERIAALLARIEADLALGRQVELIPELTDLVVQYPLQERFRAQLMIALYHDGQQAEALHIYEAGRRLLAEELGIDPSSTLRAVHRRILSMDPTLLGSETPHLQLHSSRIS